MSFNSLGTLFTVTSFGESHGEAIGAVIDGCPANMVIDFEAIQHQLNRRRPGQSDISTSRNEPDEFKIISGIFEGKTTGAPITIIIENKEARSADYENIKKFYRPSHADFVYDKKYGHYDYRGGGRSSARTTAPMVAAGAIAMQILAIKNISICSYVSAIGAIALMKNFDELNLSQIDASSVRCPDIPTALLMENYIYDLKAKGDTVGGVVKCVVRGVPVGLGEPLFEKLNANLAKAMFSINAVRGVAFGDGFESAQSLGSIQNDVFEKIGAEWHTKTNHSGGIQGGISNGMDIHFEVAFKPVATLMQPQTTADKNGDQQVLEASGRHDTCVVPRAVPIVEAYAAIIILNQLLIQRASKEFAS